MHIHFSIGRYHIYLMVMCWPATVAANVHTRRLTRTLSAQHNILKTLSVSYNNNRNSNNKRFSIRQQGIIISLLLEKYKLYTRMLHSFIEMEICLDQFRKCGEQID